MIDLEINEQEYINQLNRIKLANDDGSRPQQINSVDNKSQTSKNRFERNKNTDKIFSLPNSAVLEGKHVLLLDDVITTGATILSCGQILLTVKNLRLSVAALAVTNSL